MPLLMMSPIPKRVIQVLKDFLPEELDLIDVQMADGIVTPDIQDVNYFTRDKRNLASFPAVTTNIVSSDPVEVRPTQFGRRIDARHNLEVRIHVTGSMGDGDILQELLSRYAAGVIRVCCILHESLQTLEDPSRFAEVCEWLRPLSYGVLPTQNEGAIVRTVTIPLSVRRREVRD